MPNSSDDFTPVSRGRKLTPDKLRAGLSDVTLDAKTALDRQIVRMMALHPNLQIRFRSQDLSQLDDSTKQTLLGDMNRLLGIKPLRPAKK